MTGLERVRLASSLTEGSSVLAVESEEVLAWLNADDAWWVCHDEGGLETMLSIVSIVGGEWSIQPIALASDGPPVTDAEALTRVGGEIYIFGSNALTRRGRPDHRRSFVARFAEASVVEATGPIPADVLALGTDLTDVFLEALDSVETLGGHRSINVEGVAVMGADLLVGLRWPVASTGQPIVLRSVGAVETLTAAGWTSNDLTDLVWTVQIIEVGATSKRPQGVRGMATVGSALHLVTGQTERGLADKKVKAGRSVHVAVSFPSGGPPGAVASTTEVRSFEGLRKVEGLASMRDGRWVYVLDDEDAIVLVVGDG